MNTTLKTKEEIKKSFDDLLGFKNEKEADAHNEYMLMFRFLSEVEGIMEEKDMTKKKLATLIGTSASYVTQIFNGNKIVNLDTLAKIERALDIKFDIKAKGEELEIESSDIDFLSSFFEALEKTVKAQEPPKIDWKVYVIKKDDSPEMQTKTVSKKLKVA